jgi:hypothetical protein
MRAKTGDEASLSASCRATSGKRFLRVNSEMLRRAVCCARSADGLMRAS